MIAKSPEQGAVASAGAVMSALARRYMEWSVRGPTLEASTAMAAMAQEAAAHARAAKRAAGDAWSEDAMPIPSVTGALGSWPALVGTASQVEGALMAVLQAMEPHKQLLPQLAKMRTEKQYHLEFMRGWVAVLANDATAAGVEFRRAGTGACAEALEWLASLGLAPATEISPPQGLLALVAFPDKPRPEAPACPTCGARETDQFGSFGRALLTRQMTCGQCGSDFEAVRAVAVPKP